MKIAIAFALSAVALAAYIRRRNRIDLASHVSDESLRRILRLDGYRGDTSHLEGGN